MIIHSSENVSIIYVEKRELLYFTIVGFTKSNEISDALNNFIEQRQNIKSNKMLVDGSKFGVLRQADFNIIIGQIIPMLKEIGIEKAALLNTKDVFGNTNFKSILKEVDQSKVKLFEDMNTAEAWLLN